MAKEERLTPDDVVKTDKPARKKAKNRKNFFKAIADWFRGMKSELKKVVWPTPKQLVNNTVVAIVVMIVCAIVVWGFDALAGAAVRALITVVG